MLFREAGNACGYSNNLRQIYILKLETIKIVEILK
jgi:hypothetical protein